MNEICDNYKGGKVCGELGEIQETGTGKQYHLDLLLIPAIYQPNKKLLWFITFNDYYHMADINNLVISWNHRKELAQQLNYVSMIG